MSTPKNNIVPGTVVIITDVKTDSNIYSNKIPVTLTPLPGGTLSGHIEPALGEEIEILSKPKKVDSINVVRVKYKNTEFYTYYCSIRYMTKIKTI